MSDEPSSNLCLKCLNFNIYCRYGKDTKCMNCSDFVEKSTNSAKDRKAMIVDDSMIPVTIDSIRVSLMNYQRVVILKEKDKERYLPCWIGPAEADAIAVKLQGVPVPSPLTHDFICTTINALGGTVKSAIITKLHNDTFYAKIIIDFNAEQIDIDCRPSDALAVAVRLGIPIFVDEKVLEKAGKILGPETGKPVEESSEATGSTSPDPSRFEIFSESAQEIMEGAEIESKRLNNAFIGTVHILLSLIKNSRIVSELLKNQGVDLVNLENALSETGTEGNESGLTSSLKEAIKLSINEARLLGSEKVKPEHFLLGLVRSNSIATDLLTKQGINPEKIYIGLIKLYTLGIVS